MKIAARVPDLWLDVFSGPKWPKCSFYAPDPKAKIFFEISQFHWISSHDSWENEALFVKIGASSLNQWRDMSAWAQQVAQIANVVSKPQLPSKIFFEIFKKNFEEAVYFLPLSSQKFLVPISSTSEGWKAALTLEPPPYDSGKKTMSCLWILEVGFWTYRWIYLGPKMWFLGPRPQSWDIFWDFTAIWLSIHLIILHKMRSCLWKLKPGF